ncbi:cytochrome c3 family protein [Sediminitomix flava]|uniref:Putative CXXCH cytochrome family protein n=1 Tax=Sediminitomix flava TaxID=379075 RepID=A0A315ZB48_SEDFL|nr:cytochrome c3 family protein [Sediminitomix flava]PWJ41944.1 putative CXXCH cytochrome family protein [Sediminitomix flava]
MKNKLHLFLPFLFLYLGTSFFLLKCNTQKEHAEVQSHEEVFSEGYIGSKQCISCHQEETQKWQNSHHDLAMQKATPKYVRGDFNNVRWEQDSMQYLFYQNDSSFFVKITEEGKTTDYEVKYTFGWEPLQQYLIEFPNGKYQTLRATWDTELEKWFHQYPDSVIPSHDWLHWTGNAQNWNNMCAACHSTNLHKNFDEETDSYNTTFSEINVACEACHGPGEEHVKAMNAGEEYKDDVWSIRSQEAQISACGTCHARKTMITNDNNPHPEYLDYFFPVLLTKDNYHPDGQIDNEDYVLSSFLSSKMYAEHVRCTSCHDPHTTKLKFNGDMTKVCLQCHSPKYTLEEHHFHEMGSEGAECVNCHMDGKEYMGNDYRRDHSFRIPRPDQSVEYGTPNACNKCHTDKSPTWAKEAVEKNFGKERPYHFSDDLLPGSKLDEKSAPYLLKLIKDRTQNDIVRATALQYLYYVYEDKHADVFIKALEKEETPLVRQAAYLNILQLPISKDLPQMWEGLNDSTRAIRLASFRLLADQNVPQTYQSAYNTAKAEYEEMLYANADMVNGQVQKGEYHLRMGEPQKAIKAYRFSLKMDSLQVPVRINLAILLSQEGQTYDAIETLEPCQFIEKENPLPMYYLGLLYSELNDFGKASFYIEKAAELDQDNDSYMYNLIVIKMKGKELESAYRLYSEALQKWPNSQRINSLTPYFNQQ